MKKWNTVFANLAVSYLSLVLVIVLLLCSAFYLYFAGSYKEELRAKHQLKLEKAAQTIENQILARVEQIYVDLSLDKQTDVRRVADASLRSQPSWTVELHEALKSRAASHSDIIQAIHLYSSSQQVLLSSSYGLIYHADQGRIGDWIAEWSSPAQAHPQPGSWTASRMVQLDLFSSVPDSKRVPLLTYVRGYPFPSAAEAGELLIVIDVKDSALQKLMLDAMPDTYDHTFLLGTEGKAMTDINPVMSELHGYTDAALDIPASAPLEGSYSYTVDGQSYVLSYQTLAASGWRLYSAVPAEQFYQQSIFAQRLVLGIGTVATLIGLILAVLFARVHYEPIQHLVHKLKGWLGAAAGSPTNEYRLIDTAFVRLRDQVNSLEETLQASSPMIRRNALLKLLHHRPDRELPAEAASSLGLAREYNYYGCMLIQLKHESAHPSLILDRLQALTPQEGRLIAEELGANTLAVVVCSDAAGEDLMHELSCEVMAASRDGSGLELQLSWGDWASGLTKLCMSYKEAEALLKYGYFFPERAVLSDRSLLLREASSDELPPVLLLKLKDKLHARQPQAVAETADQLVAAIREGSYAADYCRYVLGNAVFVFSDYLKSVNYQPPGLGKSDLYHHYNELPDLAAFRSWLVETAAAVISHIDKRTSERSVSSIEAAQRYIQDHLSEDLSLDHVAGQVFISPKYLSKLFKEELGVTYTDYVTSQRMERAKALIEGNTMTIEQVASSVGYSTAAYFIKKFKERHGCTPRNYMRHTVNQA